MIVNTKDYKFFYFYSIFICVIKIIIHILAT